MSGMFKNDFYLTQNWYVQLHAYLFTGKKKSLFPSQQKKWYDFQILADRFFCKIYQFFYNNTPLYTTVVSRLNSTLKVTMIVSGEYLKSNFAM